MASDYRNSFAAGKCFVPLRVFAPPDTKSQGFRQNIVCLLPRQGRKRDRLRRSENLLNYLEMQADGEDCAVAALDGLVLGADGD